MTVTEITYSRLVSFGSYENATFSATARISPDEDVFSATKDLKWFVEDQAEKVRLAKETWRKAQTDIDAAEHRLAELNRDVANAAEKFERLATILEKHGVDISEPGVPF